MVQNVKKERVYKTSLHLRQILTKSGGFLANLDTFYTDCVFIMSHTCFRVNLHSVVAWMSRNSLLETGTITEI